MPRSLPGSSAYLDRGLICYSNKAKSELLAVPPEVVTALLDGGGDLQTVLRITGECVQGDNSII
ncbi:MAG: CinA family protein [Acidobacteriia bacterium]|nr:CinA family protein [Terriglobia bacterium]